MNRPYHTSFFLAVLLISTANADGLKELDAARSAYQKSVLRATEPLKARYLSDLTRLRETFTRAGKLSEAVTVENEIRSLSGQSELAPLASVESSDSSVVISARSDTGTKIGPAKKGQRFRIQYVEGLWASSGNTSVSPDNAPHSFAKVAVIGVMGDKEEVVTIIPSNTKSRSFSDKFEKDYEQVFLRINDTVKRDNFGEVTYKVTIK